MSEPKTKLNDASVVKFLASIENEQQRKDSFDILELMKAITKEEPKMWGDSIIGYGTYHYVYASGKEADWMRIGFSPRKGKISLYLMCGVEHPQEILDRIGKYKTGKSCFYINKLRDIDRDVLKELIESAVNKMNELYPQ
ncbi:MAG: DUF1801 domain-containing protein [Cyclobacteriaceae bacterium]|nr:DUF1801 domain-containing protein [Cyclobacteriaceae bacterium]